MTKELREIFREYDLNDLDLAKCVIYCASRTLKGVCLDCCQRLGSIRSYFHRDIEPLSGFVAGCGVRKSQPHSFSGNSRLD
jgi:hypothetical protein